ncbi:MAG TPA: hypothetical protein VGT79_00650 [Xanthomonadaceae bacterium]|nr:hypothetical protein [Xanthomonadaceae bacterium]
MGTLLHENTPRILRNLLALFGFAGLVIESLLCYMFSYSLFMNSASISMGLVLQTLVLLIACLLVAAIPIAIVVTNLHRRRSDALLLATMPLTLFVSGVVVEIARHGF